MGVYIKGMEMPKSCWQCQLLEGHRDDGLCKAANRWLDDEDYFDWYQYPEGDIDTSKPINCPLVEVPTPHGRLIDADAFIKGHCNICDGSCENTYCDCLSCEDTMRCDMIQDFANAPTIIESDGE